MVLDFRAASPDSFGTSTLNLKQFQNSIGRHTGEKQWTVEDNTSYLQPTGLSPLQQGYPRLYKRDLLLSGDFPWLVPLWNPQAMAETEPSCACRKLNVPIHPASLNKSLLLVNTAISPHGHWSMGTGWSWCYLNPHYAPCISQTWHTSRLAWNKPP